MKPMLHKPRSASSQPMAFILLLLLSSAVTLIASAATTAGENPFTPKAYLIRYWNNKIYKVPRPAFLLSKASPLSAADAAAFANLAAQNALSTHLDTFCKSAQLLCFPEVKSNLEKHDKDANFASYSDQNFTNYGTDDAGGADSFKKYGIGEFAIPIDTFRRYSRDSTGHDDKFSQYASASGEIANVVTETFNTYGTSATGGTGDFKHYADNSNVPGLTFTSYSASSNARDQGFFSYSDNANAGTQNFASYGKNGNGAGNTFTSYGNESNVIGSGFSSYSEGSNVGTDKFTSYGENLGNVPENTFKNYGADGNAVVETFKGYRDRANVGDDSFESYAKKSNAADLKFTSYGQSFNEGTDKFTGYGEGANNVQAIGFTTYAVDTTFKDYTKDGVTFAKYNSSIDAASAAESARVSNGRTVNKWVEPGKFFREEKLKSGVVMPMPDIKDKMPQRSFLPRSIVSKIPFVSSKAADIKQLFRGFENSTMATMIDSALSECERAPSRGETKRCVGSAEDMIDFAVSVLGRSTELRTTENVNGAKGDILIGNVKGINGGNVTHSVSCHQSLYPYLLYYCHSVPKVRVYEADILDPTSKAKINHGIAICHLDTTDWSATHGAFLALGSGPGKIEVCHWIFENDLTWTIAD